MFDPFYLPILEKTGHNYLDSLGSHNDWFFFSFELCPIDFQLFFSEETKNKRKYRQMRLIIIKIKLNHENGGYIKDNDRWQQQCHD